MLNTRQGSSSELVSQSTANSNNFDNLQHGKHAASSFLSLPAEGVGRITSLLDPSALLALGRVNHVLRDHIKDDVTWHRAFLCHFFGVSPETDLSEGQALLLRRFHRTWRKEYIARYELCRRWRKSRNSTIAHIPVHSSISSMHIMPANALLTSSLQFGVVARSLPLTGKVIRGYLDAAGTGGGLGIGNPNMEFSPHVTTCALTSEGGSAKIAWGYRSGEVSIIVANRAMDTSSRTAAKHIRSRPSEEHGGAVLDVVWGDSKARYIVSGSADGFVKIWDSVKVRCLWTSSWKAHTVVPDGVIKLCSALQSGVLACFTKTGEIGMWHGFDTETDAFSSFGVQVIWIPRLFEPDDGNTGDQHEIMEFRIDKDEDVILLFVAFKQHPQFYRVTIDIGTNTFTITVLGEATGAPITSIGAFLTAQPGEKSLIITGDILGCMSIYDWRSTSTSPKRKFIAHGDSSTVTALAWNGVVLVTGSSRGQLHVFDSLSFEHLRTLAPTVTKSTRRRGAEAQNRPAGVSQILLSLDKEVLFASVDDKVLAWRAGPVPQHGGGGVRCRKDGPPRKKDKFGGHFKYQERLELNETISDETKMMSEERKQRQATFGREKEQRERLETLGLSEHEALEYILMLSRDEAAEAGQPFAPHTMEEGVFGDLDDMPSTVSALPNGDVSTSFASVSGTSTPRHERVIQRIGPSSSNNKIQISPRLIPEPTEAGTEPSSLGTSMSFSSVPRSFSTDDEHHFPSISSSRGSPDPRHSPTTTSTSGLFRASVSPESSRGSRRPSPPSVWSSGLRRISASPGAVGSSGNQIQTLATKTKSEDVMDEELKLAIELSLAEARSRGEAV